MKAFVVFAVAILAGSSAMAAQTVLVAAPKGVPAKLGAAFADAVKKEIAPLRVTKIPGVKASRVSDRVKELGAAATAKRALFAVDAVVEGKKKLIVIAADPNGDTVYEKTVAWPKAPPKQKSTLVSAAREVAAALKGQAPPPDTVAVPPSPPIETPPPSPPTTGTAAAAPADNNDAFSAGAAPPWMAGGASAPAPTGEAAAPTTTATEKATDKKERERDKERDKSHKSGRGPFRLAIGPMGGGAGYKEHIDSSRNQGDRDIKVSFAPEYGGQLELEHEVGLRLDAFVLKQSATLKPSVQNAADIDLDNTYISGRLSFALVGDNFPLAIMVGGSYEKVNAGSQPDVLWVPSNKLLTTLVGLTLSHGDLTTVGTTFEIGLAFLPYGKHQRTSDTVKTDSKALGGAGWARVRYQWPKAMGSSAGFFIEAAGNARYMTLNPGDVTLPADDGTVRTLALPVGDVRSYRIDYSATASVGIMWRPGD